MAITAADRATVINDFKRKEGDTGSSEVQIALLTQRIRHLTEHLKSNKHDFKTRYGLAKMVSRRRKLLKYVKRTDLELYKSLLERLNLRG